MKEPGLENLDYLPQGAFDSAEITDLVGLYILYIFKDKIKEIDLAYTEMIC